SPELRRTRARLGSPGATSKPRRTAGGTSTTAEPVRCGCRFGRPWSLGGGEGRGEVGDSRALADKAHLTLPALRAGPLPLRPEGRRGTLERQQPLLDFVAEAGDGGGELVRAAGGFAEPERHVGRLALGILDADR